MHEDGYFFRLLVPCLIKKEPEMTTEKRKPGKGNNRLLNTWNGGRQWFPEKTSDGSSSSSASVRFPRKRKENVKLEDMLIYNRDS
jgi:hypothetical protein